MTEIETLEKALHACSHLTEDVMDTLVTQRGTKLESYNLAFSIIFHEGVYHLTMNEGSHFWFIDPLKGVETAVLFKLKAEVAKCCAIYYS